MTDKLIWRIEDKDGVGPYNGIIHTEHFRDPDRNPSPGRNPLLSERGVLADYLPPPMLMPPTFLFGFSHPDQAQSWFYDPKIMKREKWEAHGGHIEIYQLDDALEVFAEAKAQTVFVSTHTKDLGSLPLSDLWTETPDQMEAQAAKLTKGPQHDQA